MTRIGTVNYATEQGLGILVRDFHREGVVTDIAVVKHSSRPNHGDTWYPGSRQISGRAPLDDKMKQFLKSMDAMLFFETPFNWDIIRWCRTEKIRTVLMPMYECMPRVLPAQPDMIIAPSLLDRDYYPGSEFIPVPVPRSISWRKRERGLSFVHNAGHGGLKGRNGTAELVEAMNHVTRPIRLQIRSQSNKIVDSSGKRFECGAVCLFDIGYAPYGDLFAEGDVFVFPEKFNGLSLPLQEAYASGMAVACTHRYPMTSWLPTKPMIPAAGYKTASVGGSCNTFKEALINPKDIAATLDAIYDTDITALSLQGKEWAEQNSWDILKPRYMEKLLG